MPKLKITDEEFERLENSKQHEELVSALTAIAKRDDKEIVEAISRLSDQIASLLRKDFTGSLVAELKPLIKELTASVKDLKSVYQKPPASFRVQRSSVGLIERIVMERNGN